MESHAATGPETAYGQTVHQHAALGSGAPATGTLALSSATYHGLPGSAGNTINTHHSSSTRALTLPLGGENMMDHQQFGGGVDGNQQHNYSRGSPSSGEQHSSSPSKATRGVGKIGAFLTSNVLGRMLSPTSTSGK